MSYIIKKNEPLVNLKLTNTGRRNLSQGKLTFSTFSLGDGEMDYSSDQPSIVKILRPSDQPHDIQYPVPISGNITKSPISILTSSPIELSTKAKERGFFIYENNEVFLDTTLTNVANINIKKHSEDEFELMFDTVTGDTVFNNYKLTIDTGDLLFIKLKTAYYTDNYTDNTDNKLTSNPIPYLTFSIVSVNNTDTIGFNDINPIGSVIIKVDRNVPNFDDYSAIGFIYPSNNPIANYYDYDDPIAYWSGGLLDFTTNCTQSNDDVPVWNMNIVTIEDFIGLDSLFYKGKFNSISRDIWGTAINYDYFTGQELSKIGVIHYTNNTVSNFYAEGFYRDTFKLKIPYLMWHKKQFSGPGTANEIGYTFICDTELKFMGTNVKFYDLIDQETNPTIIGKVLPDQKIVIIEHPELLSALSYKSNRNWTLPKPKLTLTEPGVCGGSSFVGSIKPNESLHVSYLLVDTNGITGAQCEDYSTANNLTEVPKDVLFEFPRNTDNPNYSEFSYLKNYNDKIGYGFQTNTILLLWQKTEINTKPDPSEWNYLNVNTFLNTNGCVTNVTDICDNFELYSESTIYPLNFINNEFSLTKKEIGDVIISVNGLILKQASNVNNVGVDGDYYKYPLLVKQSVNNTSVIKIDENILTDGAIVQAHYLVGSTTTSSTIREDYDIPVSGIPETNTYLDGIYLSDGLVNLTLNQQPNNGVVYLFYNGQLISSNNYSVYPTGSIEDRRVELSFIPSIGSQISLFYLDNSGLGQQPINTQLTSIAIDSLRVNLDKNLLDISVDTKYEINDFIKLPQTSDLNAFSFGDETIFFGNIETDIKATIYKSLITCNVLPNTFISTANPTFNPNQDKVAFTEIGIYDEDDDLVAIGKFSEPLRRKFNSDMLIIQATIDF